MIKAILLAAGKSKRLRSENKLIKKFKNKPLINHSLKNPHWVVPTNVWSKEDRNTLNGFVIDKNLDIPETWKNRKDISVIE